MTPPLPFHRDKRRFLAAGILAFILSSHVFGAEDTAQLTIDPAKIKDSAFQDGLQSLKNNLPLIASKQFKRSLEKQKGKLDLSQQDIIKGFLAESLIRADVQQEALDILTLLPQTPENNYWTAIALAKQGKLTEALKWLARIDMASLPEEADENPQNQPQGATSLRHSGKNHIPWLKKAILEAQAYISMELDDDDLLMKVISPLASMKDSQSAFNSRLWMANILAQKGKSDKAAEILLPLLNYSASGTKSSSLSLSASSLKPYAELVMARIDADRKDWISAVQRVEKLAGDQTLPGRIRELAILVQASIQIARDKESPHLPGSIIQADSSKEQAHSGKSLLGAGEDQILSFIAAHPDSPLIVDAFKILIKEKTFLTNPQAQEKLYSWVENDNENRRPMADYALAVTLNEKKDLDGALKVTESSLANSPDNPVTHALLLRSLYWLLKSDKMEQAEQFLEKYPQILSAQALFSAGCIAYKRGEFEKAEKLFNDSIKIGSDKIIPSALFNANLTSLAAGNSKNQANLLSRQETTPEVRERLAFEQAHYTARQMLPESINKLSSFISSYPNSPLRIPACLDLIEVCLNQSPPDTAFAQKELEKISNIKLNEDELFRISCLRVLLDEVQQNWAQAIAGCRGILKSFPNRKEADFILLKLGDLLYRNGDFNETLLVLQGLPEKYPNSAYIPAALFLAGKAAQLCNTDASLKKALELFEQLSQEKGAFSQSAQIEIASLLLRRGQSQEAIDLLQKMLSGEKLSRQTRLLAMSIEADAWSSLSGSSPNALSRARELCSEMLSTPGLKISWKFKALFQRAQYAEKAGDLNAALSDYADILQYMDEIKNPNRRDWYWFYNAGFSALHLLEMQKKWNEALALATKLAQTTGPKAREAANIARRIKLEHFIWTEVDENETDSLHQKDIQLPVLKPLSK